VIGGYGATGSVVVSELRKSGVGEVLIGGRDAAKGTPVDILDARSLDDFCRRCSIIVNCAGPVMTLRDRVAQAAFRNRCHYVDLAGLSFVKKAMLPHSREMADLGLSCVVSAGWAPGLTELLPVYAYTQARTQMDSIEWLRVYFADSGDWSDNALRDGVWHLRRTGIPKPGYFEEASGFGPRCRKRPVRSIWAILSVRGVSVCFPCRSWTKLAGGSRIATSSLIPTWPECGLSMPP
jgi:hypothetical protein